MKYLKGLNYVVSLFKIKSVCDKYSIKNYTINSDGSIDVKGSVSLFHYRLTKLPIRFNRVTGNFDCSYTGLISLENSPREVGGSFDCSGNRLRTLEFGPEKVDAIYNCSHNYIETLKYYPKEIGQDFYCNHNPLPKKLLYYIKSIDIIMRESEDFSIWRKDGSLDELRFKYMMTVLKEEGKI